MKIQAMRVTSLIAFLFVISQAKAQILFTESFNESDGSTTGIDNTGGVNWVAVCPGSIAATDYFQVQNGRLEARDTNGPAASWTTSDIDITSCNSLEISFTISESGTMEACGTGCNSADFIAFEYSIDGGSWISPGNAYSCGGACPPSSGMAIADDDITSMNYVSDCISLGGGSNLRLRIEAQCWAGSEYWRIDDVTVSCDGCSTLPVELASFTATEENGNVQLEWETTSEENNDFFTIERSYNAAIWQSIGKVDGTGTTQKTHNYDTLDRNPLKGTSYYRLKQTDFNGNFKYSDVRSVNIDNGAPILIYPNPATSTVTVQGDAGSLNAIRVISATGQDVTEKLSQLSSEKKMIVFDISEIPRGVYFFKTLESTHKLTKL